MMMMTTESFRQELWTMPPGGDGDENEPVVAVIPPASLSAPVVVWIGLMVMAGISFWCQAVLTEERFVPALNVIARTFHIPNDIAGATLMAAGASSPELLSSFVSLFITHSALGLGTIVGSEIFNQLIICAGAIFASRSGYLPLDRIIVIREVGFYALSILVLGLALRHVRPDPTDFTTTTATTTSAPNHVYISFFDSCVVFAGYILYVMVCANMKAIVKFFTSKTEAKTGNSGNEQQQTGAESDRVSSLQQVRFVSELPPTGAAAEAQHKGKIPFFMDNNNHQQQSTATSTTLPKAEPMVAAKFRTVELYKTLTGQPSLTLGHNSDDGDGNRNGADDSPQRTNSQRLSSTTTTTTTTSTGTEHGETSLLLATRAKDYTQESKSPSFFSDGNSLRRFQFTMTSERPSHHHGLYDIELNEFEESLSCFLWQQSCFYTHAKFATHGWHLRWFTITPTSLRSVPDRGGDLQRHCITYPITIRQALVDRERCMLQLVTPPDDMLPDTTTNPTHGDYYYLLMAPSGAVLDAFLEKLETLLQENEKRCNESLPPWNDKAPAPTAASPSSSNNNVESFEDYVSLVEYPTDASTIGIILFFALYPFRWLMHYTIPDVRVLNSQGAPVSSLSTAILAILSCLLWLIVMSYSMVTSLEALAALMKIPDAVVGVTVSAAGTSLPNYIASKVAAQNGFGNMAVSNAFGSNTFNIMVGLGLPWVLYTSFGTGFQPYHALRDEGITESVVILATVLAVFVVLILASDFVLYRWHGILFVVMYIAYLAYAIGEVYW